MAVKRITYVGPHEAVELEHPVAGWLVVERGADVALPAEIADNLLEQLGNWSAAPTPAPAPSPAPPQED